MADEDAVPTAASDIYATGCIGLEVSSLFDAVDINRPLKLSHADSLSRETVFMP
jgi:hypothetical protein